MDNRPAGIWCSLLTLLVVCFSETVRHNDHFSGSTQEQKRLAPKIQKVARKYLFPVKKHAILPPSTTTKMGGKLFFKPLADQASKT
jgi:hypothetical protein